MNAKWVKIALCGTVGFGFNIWLAQHCLLDHSPPVAAWLPLSAQTYWDRYADPSPNHGPAQFDHVSGAIGCDFLIIDAAPPGIGDAAHPRMMITRAGFPLRSFEGMHSWGPVTPPYSWSLPIEPRALNVAWVSVLPYRPIPLGIAFNTALWGAITWAAFFGPAALYRKFKEQRRRLMHCCHQCGYDLRGDLERGCPECGWRRDVTSEAAPDERSKS